MPVHKIKHPSRLQKNKIYIIYAMYPIICHEGLSGGLPQEIKKELINTENLQCYTTLFNIINYLNLRFLAASDFFLRLTLGFS